MKKLKSDSDKHNSQCKRLIKAMCALSPTMPVNPAKCLKILKMRGLDEYMRNADSNTRELSEIAELLIRMERRGVQHGSR